MQLRPVCHCPGNQVRRTGAQAQEASRPFRRALKVRHNPIRPVLPSLQDWRHWGSSPVTALRPCRACAPSQAEICRAFGAIRATNQCVWLNNEERPHSSRGYKTPAEFAQPPHVPPGLGSLALPEHGGGKSGEFSHNKWHIVWGQTKTKANTNDERLLHFKKAQMSFYQQPATSNFLPCLLPGGQESKKSTIEIQNTKLFPCLPGRA